MQHHVHAQRAIPTTVLKTEPTEEAARVSLQRHPESLEEASSSEAPFGLLA